MNFSDNTDIDYNFILAEEKDPEGGFSGKAFVPVDNGGEVLGKSGVTFACGVDIGQMNAIEAKNLCGDNSSLYRKIADYVGVTGNEAQALLRQQPLQIEPAEMLFLGQRKYAEIHDRLANYYGDEFDNLPSAIKTILLSVAVQYGANLPKRTPRFWRWAVQKNWQALINELRDFGDAYKSRRNREADYLESALAMNNGTPSIL